jgi:hypothetical protein
MAKLTETLAKLAGISAGLKNGWTVSYSVSSGGASDAPQCAYPALIDYARRQVGEIASAAGVRAGSIVAIADAPTGIGGVGAPAFLVSATGAFGSNLLTTPRPAVPTACAVTVQFQLLR